jgi:peptidyl-prolyl cis-trans isomerase C
MKAFSFLFLLCASFAWAQSAPPAADDPANKVIVKFEDGTTMTQGELQALIPVLLKDYQETASQNPQAFLNVYAVFKKAAAAAKAQNLGDKAPYKQGVEFAETVALAQAEFMEVASKITVSSEELEQYYNEHKEPFRQIKVSGIKVAFGGSAPADTGSSSVQASRIPKKVLTEDEAKAKAEKLVAQIRGGGDFAKLVLTDSDDENSKAKGGDLGVWGMTDNVPDALRAAVMSLNEGQVSDPIRQPGGFYIVHADSVSYKPLADVKDFIFDQLKQEKVKKWWDDLHSGTKVEFPKNDPPQSPVPSDPKK